MSIGSIQALLTREASALGMDMSRKTNAMVVREKKIVTRSFNKIGLVVPFDKKYVLFMKYDVIKILIQCIELFVYITLLVAKITKTRLGSQYISSTYYLFTRLI